MNLSSSQKFKTILVVDDNGINRLVPGLILRPFGWDVREVSGGQEAIDILETVRFSCVLLDISMPEVGGMDVLRFIRANDRLSSMTVVAYTAYAQSEDVSRLCAAGFDAVLIKPLTSLKLLNVLTNS